jgi:hypothetical protein
VGGRGAVEALVSERGQAGRPARLVRAALRHGRGGLDLLPAPRGGDGAALGRADARRLRHAREGLRDDDAAPRAARAAAARAQGRSSCGRARPRRTSAARVPRRGLLPLPRRARAVARRRQARRDPAAVSALRRSQAHLVRVPRMGAGPAAGRRSTGRVPPSLLARGRAPRRHARLPRGTRHDARRDGLAAHPGREEHGADRLGEHLPNGLCPAARPQRRDLERPRWKRGRALQLPLFGGGAT